MNPISKTKPLPAYGRSLEELLRTGKVPAHDVRLYVGRDAFALAEPFIGRRAVLVLPEHIEPEAVRWPAKGCTVLGWVPVSTSAEFVSRLVAELMQAGAERVYLIDTQHRCRASEWIQGAP